MYNIEDALLDFERAYAKYYYYYYFILLETT